MALTPSHLLIEVLATDPQTALVPAGTVDLLWSLSTTPVWLVVAAGRLLPNRLFEVAQREVERQDLGVETIEVSRAAQVAGPNGLETPDRLVHRIDCPVAPELLRL